MPVQQHNYPAMYHRAQTGCDLGWGGNAHSHRFFLVKSVCNGWTPWTTEPCCQLCGHRGELFTQGKAVGRKGRCWWVQILYVLRDLATTGVCPDCSELSPLEISSETKKNSEYICLIKKVTFMQGCIKDVKYSTVISTLAQYEQSSCGIGSTSWVMWCTFTVRERD